MTLVGHAGFVALLLSSMAPCQNLAWDTWSTPSLSIRYGFHTRPIADVNGDGHEDVATVVEGECSAIPFLGGLCVLSGANGSLLYLITTQPIVGPTWVRDLADAGDWNQDGAGDFATIQFGATSQAVVHSGIDGSTLFQVLAGNPARVLGSCDLDGDGRNDLLIGEERFGSNFGLVKAYSHSGALLYQLSGTPQLWMGYALARLGDVDDDGGDDFVMGCVDSPVFYGASVIVSGKTGAPIRTCYGQQPGDRTFRSSDHCGDMDGDGYEDFVVGSGDLSARPGMVIFSSRTGQVLRSWYPTTAPGFGVSVTGRGVDYDGDGFPDVVTGAPLEVTSNLAGAVYVMSGRDGSLIHRLISVPSPVGPSQFRGGVGMRPPAGSHIGTLLVPDRIAILSQGLCPNGPIEGRILAYRGLPRTAELLGQPCPGNLAQAPDIGLQSMGATTLRAHVSGAPANVPAALLLGIVGQSTWVPTPVPLDGIGLLGCQLRSPVDLLLVTNTGSTGANVGYAFVDLPLPVPLQGNGSWWVAAQWLVLGTPQTFPGGMTQTARWRR